MGKWLPGRVQRIGRDGEVDLVLDDGTELENVPEEEIGVGDSCNTEVGSFQPIVEWTYGDGGGCLAQPIVADINQDGNVSLTDFSILLVNWTG